MNSVALIDNEDRFEIEMLTHKEVMKVIYGFKDKEYNQSKRRWSLPQKEAFVATISKFAKLETEDNKDIIICHFSYDGQKLYISIANFAAVCKILDQVINIFKSFPNRMYDFDRKVWIFDRKNEKTIKALLQEMPNVKIVKIHNQMNKENIPPNVFTSD